jgi:hypothetical protein
VLPLEFVREVIDHPVTRKFEICNKE